MPNKYLGVHFNQARTAAVLGVNEKATRRDL
jgi:hypothetical protein